MDIRCLLVLGTEVFMPVLIEAASTINSGLTTSTADKNVLNSALLRFPRKIVKTTNTPPPPNLINQLFVTKMHRTCI